jgi:hypothetical protein
VAFIGNSVFVPFLVIFELRVFGLMMADKQQQPVASM